MNKRKIDKRVLEASDRLSTSFHEAGHCIAAKHFGLKYHGYVVRVGEPTMETKAYVGKMRCQPTTPFREAVIGWSGLIAEYLADKPTKNWPDEDVEVFEDCTCLDEHSATDNKCVNAHPQRRRALKTAWRIVISHRDELATFAKMLARNALS